MKLISLVFGLALASSAASAADLAGSCSFEGAYASGCIEFIGSGWNSSSMQTFCGEKSKPDAAPVLVVASACAKNDYNTLCSTALADGTTSNMYVNDMPGFICKRYNNGTLTKRPAGGW